MFCRTATTFTLAVVLCLMVLSPHVCIRVTGVFEGSASASEQISALQRELAELDRKESALDDLIQSSTNQLRELTENKDNQRYPFGPMHACFILFYAYALLYACD